MAKSLQSFIGSDGFLPRVLRRAGRPVRTLIRRAGFEVVPRQPLEAVAVQTELLSRIKADLLVDVGANKGQYGQMLRGMGYKGPLLSLEPMRDAFQHLHALATADAHWNVLNLAAGDQPGTSQINIAGNSYSSSLLPMDDAHSDALPQSAYVGREEIRIERLDALLPAHAPQARRIYLKADTQGFEDRVLRGALGVMDRIHALELEASLSRLYDGQLLYPELDRQVRALGFYPVKIEAGFANADTLELLQIDVFYLRHGI